MTDNEKPTGSMHAPTTGAVHRERKKPQRPGSRDAAGRALLDQLVVIRVV